MSAHFLRLGRLGWLSHFLRRASLRARDVSFFLFFKLGEGERDFYLGAAGVAFRLSRCHARGLGRGGCRFRNGLLRALGCDCFPVRTLLGVYIFMLLRLETYEI